METKKILSAIDVEIARLQQARSLLSGDSTGTRGGKTVRVKPATAAKRALSPEARKRIADAQRKRWAAQKRASK